MVTRALIERYLFDRLGELKYSHQGLKANCPKCDAGNKFNLEINIDRNIFNCWSCRYSGFIRRLVEDYASDDSWRRLPEFQHHTEEHIVPVKEINYPKETIPVHLHRQAFDYLVGERGMSRRDLLRRKVSYVYSDDEVYHDHICFPFYEDGRMVGACLQDFKTKKYRNLSKLDFVPYKEFVNDLYPIFIGEGVYDVLSAVNGIPLLRTEVNDEILSFITGKDVILGVDNTVDLGHYANLLRKMANVRQLVLFDLKTFKDPNEFFMLDRKGFLSELRNCYGSFKK